MSNSNKKQSRAIPQKTQQKTFEFAKSPKGKINFAPLPPLNFPSSTSDLPSAGFHDLQSVIYHVVMMDKVRPLV